MIVDGVGVIVDGDSGVGVIVDGVGGVGGRWYIRYKQRWDTNIEI